MAAASLGRLTLDLAVKLGSFEQGMTQAERKTKQTTDNMNKAFVGFKDQVADALGGTQLGSIVDSFNTKIGSLKGGVLVAGAALSGMAVGGIAAAIGGLTHLAIETAKADSQLLVLANRANTSVKSFQILEYASQGLGVSQDQLGSILADTQEKLGEFSATQGGGAADFFDALKNNTKLSEDQIKSFSKTLQGKDGIEAIQMLNDKLDELGVTSQERRFVFESLASDLGNLAPLFAENGRLLDDYGRALEDAGILKTEEAIKQSQLLAAQTQAVNLQFQGWKNQLVSGFMPAIVDVANAIFGTSKNGIQLQQVGEGIGSVLRSVTKVALGVSAAFSIAGKLIGGVAAAIAALKGEKINTINIMFDDITATLDDYGTRINSLSESSSTASKSSNNLVNAILAVNSASTKSAKGIALDTKTADENTKAKEKQAKAAEKLAKEQAKLNGLVGASALNGLRIKSSESIAGGKVRGYTAEFAKLAQDALGSQLNRFTAFNDSYHKGTNSKHAVGQAFDFTVKDAGEANASIKRLQEVAKKYGFTIKAINEYANPSGRSTGGHVHVSVLGYKGTSEMLKDAQAELGIIASTNEEAKRIHDERLRAQQSVASQYYSELQKLEYENSESIKAINVAYAGDDAAIKKYLTLQQAAYEKDVAKYQEAQKQKELSDKKQLLEASRNWMTAGEYAREYYALVREEILNTSEYSPAMKQALIQGSLSQQNLEESYERDSAIEDYRDVMGYEENPLERQFEVLQKMRELDLLNEEKYQQDKLMLQTKYSASYMQSMLGGFAALVDENSKTYAVLFAAQKAFAVAQAMLNIPAAYSKAYDAVVGTPYVGPYIAPAVGAAAAALQVAQAASMKSVNLTGMAHDGIDNIPREGTWLLDGGERVLNPEQNKDLTRYLNESRESNSSPNVNLNPNFVIVDEREKLGDYLFGPDGKKAFVKFFKQNKRELGFA
ncbi:hypothetical protein [Acinetobacter sp. YH16038]|uniref:hypothetical protein n=1 Tax=Acinetobacter sp. YH16038 TaxID=2601183 RepID=UPI0015D2AA04|nr:hypothetical protein [Acinetobacter sp. YH16038]